MNVVAPIRCHGIDPNDILSPFSAARTSFPMRYLGLPLSPTRLRRIDFQHLEDKVAGKLKAWSGKNLTNVSREALVKAVLTS